MLLLDLSAALDAIDHVILNNIPKDVVGLSGVVLKCISSYLSLLSFSVFIIQVLSELPQLIGEVPQGSILGPILLLLYVLPLRQIICKYSDVSDHLHTDDIQLYCSFKPTEFYDLSSLMNCLSSISK